MFKSKKALVACITLWCMGFFSSVTYAGNYISVSGSSTVAPYSQMVAEAFADNYPRYRAPIVESIGTGSGIKEFCKGVGPQTLDIVNASRPMSSTEWLDCQKHQVAQIQEVMFGYDGIILASDRQGPQWDLSAADVYQALAAKVLVKGQLVDNPYRRWNEIRSSLPAWPISVYVPGEKHGSREVFEQKLLEAGCRESEVVDFLRKGGKTKEQIKQACIAMRKDGPVVDINGDYAEMLARIMANKESFGVFGLFFYENNADRLRVATIAGIEPTVEAIASGAYPLSRPLYFYVKTAHLAFVPGLRTYVEFFLREETIGDDGLLVEHGLVPAPLSEREKQRKAFSSGQLFSIEGGKAYHQLTRK